MISFIELLLIAYKSGNLQKKKKKKQITSTTGLFFSTNNIWHNKVSRLPGGAKSLNFLPTPGS
jgi:hypothetical protein